MKLIKSLRHYTLEVLKGVHHICSDIFQNWIVAGWACPIRLRPFLYGLAGNKIGKNCYISPRIFLGPGPGKLYVGGGHS